MSKSFRRYSDDEVRHETKEFRKRRQHERPKSEEKRVNSALKRKDVSVFTDEEEEYD